MTTNNDSGIEAMCPSSKDDFVAFEKLLKDKITQFEKSVHYSRFLESLFRELCISCKCRIIFLSCLWIIIFFFYSKKLDVCDKEFLIYLQLFRLYGELRNLGM